MKCVGEGSSAGKRAGLGRQAQGFTLIEVLISISLLGLLAVALVGTFLLSSRAMERASRRSAEAQELRSGTELLASYIRSAFPYRAAERDPAVLFQGGSSDLRFVSALSMGMGGRGMAEVQISWEPEPNGHLVLREIVPLRSEAEASGGDQARGLTLYRGVKDFRIAYLDPEPTEEDRWLELWDGKQSQRLPRAVKIDFFDGDGREVHWVFPIMMSVLSG